MAEQYLAERKKTGELYSDWAELEELYVKKLWHQITIKCSTFVRKSEFQSGTTLIDMYEKFITDFEHRINPLSLVEICLIIVRQYQDPNLAVAFLEQLALKVKHEQEPKILVNTAIGAIYLEQKNFDETKNRVEETEQELEKIDGVTTVHARFYELSSNYYKTIGNHCEYYKNALRYLGCIKVEYLPIEEQKQHAFFLSLAAILGEGIYNFGELLQHPILASMNDTANQWLVELLFAFNRGDLDKFEALRPHWSSQADLLAAEVKMRQKICLLCLMEISFNRSANNKQLTFKEVSSQTKLPESEIELLVMRALSLKLVKGSIDQIDNKIFISWVQPRVLDINQIKTIRSRIDGWSGEVTNMISQIQSNSHEILQ